MAKYQQSKTPNIVLLELLDYYLKSTYSSLEVTFALACINSFAVYTTFFMSSVGTVSKYLFSWKSPYILQNISTDDISTCRLMGMPYYATWQSFSTLVACSCNNISLLRLCQSSMDVVIDTLNFACNEAKVIDMSVAYPQSLASCFRHLCRCSRASAGAHSIAIKTTENSVG